MPSPKSADDCGRIHCDTPVVSLCQNVLPVFGSRCSAQSPTVCLVMERRLALLNCACVSAALRSCVIFLGHTEGRFQHVSPVSALW